MISKMTYDVKLYNNYYMFCWYLCRVWLGNDDW